MDRTDLAATFGLSSEEVQYELTHLNETKRPSILAAVGSCSALATISILLRVFVRWRNKNEFKADDYSVFIAFILSWGSFVAFYYQTTYGGLGNHILAVTPKMEHVLSISFYINIVLYILIGMFTQLSFLFLYKRCFTVYREWFRYTLYGIAVLSLTSNLSCVLASLFQCRPIKKAWEQSTPGHCINERPMFVTHAVVSLVIDTLIVAAPMPLIWTLHASFSYRAGICGMFMLGALVCIINVIKIHYFVTIPPTGDTTYKDLGASTWSHAQSCLGIVGASLPFMKSLLRNLRETFSIKAPSPAAITTSHSRSTRSNRKAAAAKYKTSNGNEPIMTESNIMLVPQDRWTGTLSFPDKNSKVRTKSTIEAGCRRGSVERDLSSTEIAVTRGVDVSSSSVEEKPGPN